VLNQISLALLSVTYIIFHSEIKLWYAVVPANILLICGIYFLVTKYEREASLSKEGFSFLRILRFWYSIGIIIICFKETYYIIHSLKPDDWDAILIKADFAVFGVNPTQWVYRFANPASTEFLQIIYFFYYFIIIIYGLELYLWKRYDEYKYATFIICTGFYLSYILYVFFPAIGPRFILHNFGAINTELPGIFFTKWIRAFLDFGESIPPGVMNAQDFAQRDAMPSAHTSLALLVVYLSKKIKSKSFYFYLPYLILMVISTIYLRYHYIIDIAAGVAAALITILIGKIVYRNDEISRRDYANT
jgi:membrane-associated phospholipid phosphatase